MADKTFWESVKVDTDQIGDKIREIVHEGNVRRVVVQHQGRTIAEFPLTAGVVGAALAPPLAALGALIALLKDCTIQVERVDTDAGKRSA
jgi:hypothetical protein